MQKLRTTRLSVTADITFLFLLFNLKRHLAVMFLQEVDFVFCMHFAYDSKLTVYFKKKHTHLICYIHIKSIF